MMRLLVVFRLPPLVKNKCRCGRKNIKSILTFAVVCLLVLIRTPFMIFELQQYHPKHYYYYNTHYDYQTVFNNSNEKENTMTTTTAVAAKKNRTTKNQQRFMPKLQLTKKYPTEYLNRMGSFDTKCLNLDPSNSFDAGWGNIMFLLLYAMLTHKSTTTPTTTSISDSDSLFLRLPCILDGEIGNIVTNIFGNIERCPTSDDSMNIDDRSSCASLIPVEPYTLWGWEIMRLVKDPETIEQRKFLLTLNETYVENYLLSSSLISKLQTRGCGIHIRFGDDFLTGQKDGNQRMRHVPQCYKSDEENNRQHCFSYLQRWIDSVCPPDIFDTIFLATDYPKFRDYVLSKQEQQHDNNNNIRNNKREILVTDLSNVNGTIRHLHDVNKDKRRDVDDDDNKSTTNHDDHQRTTNPHIINFVKDWISLGLSKEVHAFSESTFVDTSTFGLNI